MININDIKVGLRFTLPYLGDYKYGSDKAFIKVESGFTLDDETFIVADCRDDGSISVFRECDRNRINIGSNLLADLFSVATFSCLKSEVGREMPRKSEIDFQKTSVQDISAERMVKFINTMRGKILSEPNVSFEDITKKMFDTYTKKNHDYGNAFSEMYDELGINYGYGKIREKVNRIKILKDNKALVDNEPLEDALLDCANYCILTLMEYQKRKNETKE